jgi:uncharacterized protein (TIGR00251 family)
VAARASLTLAVKVTPRAKADEVLGWSSAARDELSVRVTAAPEGGKANAAVVRTLARSLSIPKSAVEVIRGHTSRQKLVALAVDEQHFQQWSDALPQRR